MALKSFEIDGIGTILVSKRRGSRNMRLSIAGAGEVRLSIPYYTPYQTGLDFARSRSEWIKQNAPAKDQALADGNRVGKAHRMMFMTAAIDTPSARLAGNEIRILRPYGMAATHRQVQAVARRAAVRALRTQAEALLPPRLEHLAARHGFTYNGVRIKQLKGRWGSCDNNREITLNLFLMQLPWQLIDYVLLHELIHTVHMNHGPEFWNEFIRREPLAKSLRKVIRVHKPVLRPAPGAGSVV